MVKGSGEEAVREGTGPVCEDCGKALGDGARMWEDAWQCAECALEDDGYMHGLEFPDAEEGEL